MRGSRRLTVWMTTIGLAAGVAAAVAPVTAQAAPPTDASAAARATSSDELTNPIEAKRRALKQKALADVLSGRATTEKRGPSTVVKVGDAATTKSRIPGARSPYVELARETTDEIFVVLAEFGNRRDPLYPDQDTDPDTPGPIRFGGPLHNQIPRPPADDNATIWQADYDRQHYQDLYFATGAGVQSLATYYSTQSSGRYSVRGQVTNWVKVPYNEARYGRSNGYPCADIVCNNTYDLIRDAVKAWVDSQRAQGQDDQQIAAGLARFDKWDRTDYDADGDFNEPDGYIDHFQIVHAGGDQADGDPIYGEDAIWSHRGFAYDTAAGGSGPAGNLLGGTQIGRTGLWVGDYTVQPENGGLDVFAHEYGHDLGLPDSYDTTSGSDGPNGFWTLMCQSRLSGPGEPVGTRAGDLGAWQKLQLGWLDYETLVAGQNRTLTLGPAEYNSAHAQAAVVVLPRKTVVTQYGAPYAGERQWWSGQGDSLTTTLTRSVDLTGKPSATLTFQTRYDIEQDYDYLYVQSSTDGGTTWTSLDGTVDGAAFPRDGAGKPALTGTSDGYVAATVPVPGGAATQLRFLYKTDLAVQGQGFFADQIAVTSGGQTLVTDGAEDGDNGWTAAGFTRVGTSASAEYDNFYIAANRTYVGYDRYLESGPYNYPNYAANPGRAEHFPYQQGVLLTYWDTSQADNNTSVHPGQGLELVVDAHPRTTYTLSGAPWRPRIQKYDAPFGRQPVDSFTLNVNGRANYMRGAAPAPTFDDTKPYWFANLPTHGVKVPRTGTTMTVVSQSGTTAVVQFGSSPTS